MKRRSQQIGLEQQKVSHVTFDDSNRLFENRHIMQENYSANQNFPQNADPYIKKSNNTSLASKFSKRWEHIPEYPILPPSQSTVQKTNYNTPIETDVSEEADTMNTQKTQRSTSNQSAEIILQDIDLLLNRVREICSKKETETNF